ncbi:MAG: hypothetical protein KatS3mg014_0773 [Actinomycetota bacterium]|nr:MAG: hypothetical protein KatS3mg014_0773 [Actinomycetota bacterium]
MGKQQGTGKKSLASNVSGICSTIAWMTSGFVSRSSGSNSGWRPACVTGWNTTARTAGCRNPNRSTSPSSASLMPRSTAATSVTVRPCSAHRSRAAAFSARRSRPRSARWVSSQSPSNWSWMAVPSSARAAANPRSRARRIPFVLSTTWRIPLARAIAANPRICGWIEGSPPENMTTPGSPSARTNASSATPTWSADSENPSGWCPEPAKHTGQSRLQAEFTSRTPRQACCLCSGHRPQSSGQPSRTSVCVSSG